MMDIWWKTLDLRRERRVARQSNQWPMAGDKLEDELLFCSEFFGSLAIQVWAKARGKPAKAAEDGRIINRYPKTL